MTLWKTSDKFLLKTGGRKAAPDFSVRRQAGFSLFELLILVVVISILVSFAVIGIRSTIPGLRANQAMHQVINSMREARMMAMSYNRGVSVRFTANNRIEIRIQIVGCEELWDDACFDAVGNMPGMSDPSTNLEHGYQLMWSGLVEDMPEEPGPGIPSGAGRPADSIVFGGASPRLVFTPDGFLTEDSDFGEPVSGTIFTGLPGSENLARAVTILGATGGIRSWRWRNGWQSASN